MPGRVVRITGREAGKGCRLFLIAGPCVVEDRETMQRTAGFLAELAAKLDILCIFKASYRKANRTSGASPSGPGIEAGLSELARIARESGLPVTTDIHESNEAAPAAEVAEILQIPAFLCRQTALIQAAASTGRVVNIKKGQFMDPRLMTSAAEKARTGGAKRVLLTERGAFFGYGDLVVDFRSLAIMRRAGCPVVYDATHSVQAPGGAGQSSGGHREFAEILARSAVAAGADGLFMEIHPDPSRALSDRETMLSLEQAARIIPPLLRLGDYIREEAAGGDKLA